MKDKIIIGIDGGATKTTGVIFNHRGETLVHDSCLGSNISVDESKAANQVVELISKMSQKIKIDLKNVSAIGIGLAGASNKNGRDRLFGILDNLKVSDRTIITNDIEPIYDYIWGTRQGILLNVGTGVICISKKDDRFIRVAGKGHDNGDIGSGYWIGREALIELEVNNSYNQSSKELLKDFLIKNQSSSYDSLISDINESENKIADIASFAKSVIFSAEKGNEFSRSIVQHATRVIAEYIIEVRDIMNYGDNDIMIAGNGSVLRNNYFRQELNNALCFDFNEVSWIFLDISPAYTPGLLSARLKSINIDRKSLNKNPIKV